MLLCVLLICAGATGYALSHSRALEEELTLIGDRADYVAANTDYKSLDAALTTAATAEVVLLRESPSSPSHAAETTTQHKDAQDDEWKTFPRSDDLDKKLSAELMIPLPSELYRNTDLNPHDVYIAPACRQTIAQAVAALNSKLGQLKSVTTSLTLAEFDTLTRAGKARTVEATDYMASLTEKERASHQKLIDETDALKQKALKERGLSDDAIAGILARSKSVAYMPNKAFGKRPFAMKSENGKFLGATLEELPKTAESIAVRKQVLLESLAQIAGMFARAGALDAATSDALLRAMADQLLAADTHR
jgi:hypothetical protein